MLLKTFFSTCNTPMLSQIRFVFNNTDSKIHFSCGDFNAIFQPSDRLMGNPVSYAEIQDFSTCIHTLLLNELQWKGEYYTWSNKQHGLDRVYSRLDRGFGNHDWMMQ